MAEPGFVTGPRDESTKLSDQLMKLLDTAAVFHQPEYREHFYTHMKSAMNINYRGGRIDMAVRAGLIEEEPAPPVNVVNFPRREQ